MGNFTAVDVIVGLIVLISALYSFFRGFVHQVLGIGAWIGAILVTISGFHMAQDLARRYIDNALGADVAAGLGLFLITLLIFSIFSKVIAEKVRNSALNSVDSSLGFVFGLVMGGFICSLIYMGLSFAFDPNKPDWLMEAKTQPWLERGSNLIKGFAPSEVNDAGAAAGRVKDDLENMGKYLPKPSLPDSLSPADSSTPEPVNSRGYDDNSRDALKQLLEQNQ